MRISKLAYFSYKMLKPNLGKLVDPDLLTRGHSGRLNRESLFNLRDLMKEGRATENTVHKIHLCSASDRRNSVFI